MKCPLKNCHNGVLIINTDDGEIERDCDNCDINGEVDE